MNYDFNLGVIGYGNMAKAIIEGGLKSNIFNQKDVLIYDVNIEKIKEAKLKGLSVTEDITQITKKCKYILLSVKPQSSNEVFSSISGHLNNNIFISIMAGVTVKTISDSLKNVKICRCMPNTPALIGKGMTAIDTSRLNEDNKDFILKIFNAVGNTIELEEKHMNAVTAVSGSGPAFVYMFINSFIKGAVSLDLTFEESKNLVLSTVLGAAEMVRQSETAIETLIENVSSKGGTTVEGLKVLKEKGLENTLIECVKSAYLRAEELSKS